MKQSLVASLARILRKRAPGRVPVTPEPLFVFVKVPQPLLPTEREERYGDPINEALQEHGLGEVSGGGSELSAPDENGKRSILWCGIDVDLIVHERGLAVLRSILRQQGAPPETVLEIHYESGIYVSPLNETPT